MQVIEQTAALADTSSLPALVVPEDAVLSMLPFGSFDTAIRWNTGHALGTPIALTYCFSDTAPSYDQTANGYTPASAQAWSAAQKACVEQVLQAYSDVAGLSFSVVTDPAQADICFFLSDSLTVAGFATFPGSPDQKGTVDGDVYFGTASFPSDGSNRYLAFHEIGHALGLAHPYDGGSKPTIESFGINGSRLFSVVDQRLGDRPYYLYVSDDGTSGGVGTIFNPTGPMLLDIAALQGLYGANLATGAGDTTYRFDPNPNAYFTLWDGGGIDTIDLSNQIHPCAITLEPGAYSSIGYRDPFAGFPQWLVSWATQSIAADQFFDGAHGLTIAFGATIENVIGSSASDILVGNAAANLLQGLGGIDTLAGGAGADTLEGGAGNDTYAVDDALDQVIESAGGGTDLVNASVSHTLAANVENLRLTGSGAINATGNGQSNILYAGAGNNVLNGSGGFDTAAYAFATGAVAINLATTGAQATGGSGTDTLVSIENLRGSSFNDSLTGNAGNNILDGGAGNDVLDGAAGIDTATYATAASAVTVSLAIAGAQNTVGAGSDTLVNIENLTGSALNDTLTGNAAVNILDGGAGNDALDGAGGVDTASYASAGAAVTVSLALVGAQNTSGAGSDTLSNIEGLRGSNFNDTLTGDAGNNTLDGGAGNDVLNGGTGFDYASYVSASGGVTVSLAIAGAQNTVGAGSDTLSNIEYLRGSSFNDSLTGSAGNNILDGGSGNDTLDGGAGSDTAFYATAAAGVNVSLAIAGAQSTVGSGSDTLVNIENLTGSGFNDTLTGNASANTLSGGAGIDTFVFNSAAAADTVTDFVSGADKLRISQAGIAIGNGNTTIDNAATIAGPGGFSTAAELVIVTGNIAGAINASSAAAAIGSATSAYAIGQKVVFAVDNGASSALYLFTAADADAAVSAAELTLLATLTTTASTTTGDFIFGP